MNKSELQDCITLLNKEESVIIIMCTDRISDWLRSTYDRTAVQYRENDEIHITGTDHRNLCQTLKTISSSFGYAITALDLGCGTGRHFHCLTSTEKLVGIDVSPHMLLQARTPVCRSSIKIDCVELRCANMYSAALPIETFDLAYCLGVFGNGCPVSSELLKNVYASLKPGGKFFFDVLDSASLSPLERVRVELRRKLYRVLPDILRKLWDRKAGWPPLYCISENQVKHLLRNSGFVDVETVSTRCHLPEQLGKKLQCLCTKPNKTSAIAYPKHNSKLLSFRGMKLCDMD